MKKQSKKQEERQKVFDKEGIEAFAIHLKKVRMAKGYSQRQLAFETGIALSQIARIETGRTNPTLSTIFILSRILDVSLSELFSFTLPEKRVDE